MLVLVATPTPPGVDPLVAPRPIDGELVIAPSSPCRCDEPCDCHRSWVGVVSGGRTATALVARRPGIDQGQLRAAVASLLDADVRELDADLGERVDARLTAMSAVLTAFPLGSVLVRDGATVRYLDLDEAA